MKKTSIALTCFLALIFTTALVIGQNSAPRTITPTPPSKPIGGPNQAPYAATQSNNGMTTINPATGAVNPSPQASPYMAAQSDNGMTSVAPAPSGGTSNSTATTQDSGNTTPTSPGNETPTNPGNGTPTSPSNQTPTPPPGSATTPTSPSPATPAAT